MANFKKTPASAPLFFLDTAPNSLAGKYCVAFLPAQETPATLTLTVTEAWQQPGVVLFLNAASDEIVSADLVARLRRLLDDPAWRDTRVLWIANPTAPLASWQLSSLPIVNTENGTETLSHRTFLDFRNYSLGLAHGSAISLVGEELALASAGGSFLSVSGVTARWENISKLRLPLTGELAGCLQFELTLAFPAEGQVYAELANLDAGFRVFYKDTKLPATDTDYFLRSLSYSFLMEQPPPNLTTISLKQLYQSPLNEDQPLKLAVSLDPLNQLNGRRTFFSLFNQDTNLELPSCFRTTMGRMVKLKPVDASSRLVFAVKPTSTKQRPNDPFYLVPAGDFEVSVKNLDGSAPPATITDRNLLCGLSGVEFVKLTEATTRMSFEPGRPAFAPGFEPAPAPDESAALATPPALESMDDLLSATATTAWAYVREKESDDSPPIYYAQPDQSIFYEMFPTPVAGDLLQAMEIPSVPLPAGEPPRAFPLLPYGGLDGKNLEDYRQLERNRLSPMRRQAIHDIYAKHRLANPDIPLRMKSAGTAPSNPATGVTPQGLLATFSADFETWTKLTLARDQFNNSLEFTNIPRGAPLRDALQSNKLFLVIADPEQVKAFMKTAGNVLKIAGWEFNFDPANWASHGTILLFKSYDKPLQELVEQPALWTLAVHFNPDQAATRATLAHLLREAVVKSQTGTPEEQEKYKPLATAATNENWAGLLALNLATPALSALPPGLTALAAGLDQTKFFARYFGIETSPVEIKGGALDLKPASLFALIDYDDETTPASTPAGYDFQVTKLTALFENSQLKSFASQLSVTLDKLFGERTELIGDDSKRNLVTMTGTVERHNGVDTYSFGFNGKNRFALPASNAIEEVEILKASFSSDPVDSTATNPLINARFTFWGHLTFHAWPGGQATDLLIAPTDNLNAVRINRGTQDLQSGDLFAVVGDPQPYQVTDVADGQITFKPSAKTKFPNDAPLRKLELNKAFDILSFGPSKDANKANGASNGLRFSNLVVGMSFNKSTPAQKTFTFDPSKLSFDLKQPGARPQSLFAKFPLTFKEFVVGNNGKLPGTLGYQPVKTPLGGTAPTEDWYGLVFDLDLGSVGALAGKAGLVTSILAAWSPGKPENGVYVGLRLPGSSGGKKEFSLQGIFKIAFKSIQFLANPEKNADETLTYSYILKLKNIQLKLMVLSLPPKAQTEFIIFGNPAGTTENRTLGWFAAYEKQT